MVHWPCLRSEIEKTISTKMEILTRKMRMAWFCEKVIHRGFPPESDRESPRESERVREKSLASLRPWPGLGPERWHSFSWRTSWHQQTCRGQQQGQCQETRQRWGGWRGTTPWRPQTGLMSRGGIEEDSPLILLSHTIEQTSKNQFQLRLVQLIKH